VPAVTGPALLFCPADRPDRYAKALAAADGAILDLEDAVAADRKAVARQALLDTPIDPGRTVVRINPAGTPDHLLDLDAVRASAYRVVMIAKTESAGDLARLTGLEVIALCETARGVLAAPEIAAHDAVTALMWGAEDLVASLGGQSSRFADGRYRDVARHARSQVLLAAGAHRKDAIDAVYLDLDDHAGLAVESADAVASGFAAKACVHPGQAAVVRAAFSPTAEQVAWARRVVAAGTGAGVVRVDGQMVDEPLLRQARRLLTRVG
jgi:citrate lyase subunit beta/citryl-CoA lyase